MRLIRFITNNLFFIYDRFLNIDSLIEVGFKNKRDKDELDEVRYGLLLGRIVSIFLVIVLAWSFFFKLDVASHSTGEVATSGKTRLVQHLEGGIIKKIYVKEGQKVKEGDLVAEVDRVSSQAELKELEAQIGALKIKKLRINAQLSNEASFKVPLDLMERFPDQVENALELLKSQRIRSGSNFEAQSQKITQRKAELSELLARKQNSNQRLIIIREQIAISEKLLKEGLGNNFEHLNLLKEEKGLQGALQEIDASFKRVESGEDQEVATLRSLAAGDNEILQKELAEANKMLAEAVERLSKFKDAHQRQQVRAPADGILMTLNINTEGGVIQPGGTLMTIVPDKERLLVESKLPIGDIGIVKLGQNAKIQLISSVARGFQPIHGKVEYISADSLLDENKIPYYKVKISTPMTSFKNGDVHYPLMPGVPVSISILTGYRSLFEYLADPITDSLRNAFTEP